MLTKKEILYVYAIAKFDWLGNENDERAQPEMIADFIVDVIENQCDAARQALINTNQLLSTLLIDPMIPKDQKSLIRARYDENKAIILAKEKEAVA